MIITPHTVILIIIYKLFGYYINIMYILIRLIILNTYITYYTIIYTFY